MAAGAALMGAVVAWIIARTRPEPKPQPLKKVNFTLPSLAEVTSPAGMWVYDHNLKHERCSERLIQMMNLEQTANPQLSQVVAGFDTDAAERLRQASAELRNFGRRFNLLLPRGGPDGDGLLQVRGARQFGPDDRPAADVIWFLDVTDLIDAGKALAPASEAVAPAAAAGDGTHEVLAREAAGWRAVIEDLDIAICVFGADKRVTLATPVFEAMFAVDPALLEGAPSQDRLLDALRAGRRLPEVADFAALKAREAARFETQEDWREDLLTLPDGRLVRARVGPTPMGGLIYAFEDVSEQFGSERRARLADRLRETALETLPEAVLVATPDGRVGLANPGFSALFGVDGEFLGTQPRLDDLIERMRESIADPDVPWDETRATWRAAFTARERAEGRFERADGTVLAYTLAPLPDGGALAAFVDVTAQTRLEDALRDRAEAEADASRAKTRFIADVSFELRNPLNAITGFAELLRGGYHGALNDRQGAYATAIRDQSESLTGVVADIVELSAIEAGTAEPQMAPLDVHAMLANLIAWVEPKAKAKAQHVVFDVDPDIGWIRGDGERLRHALAHMLSNAVRFTPDRGAIRLSAGRDGDAVSIAVSDDGIGIPKDDRSRVFDPFSHAANAPAAQRGPGLGLALVRRCAEMHGGTVAVGANGRRGTTVTVHLPADRGTPETAFADEAPE